MLGFGGGGFGFAGANVDTYGGKGFGYDGYGYGQSFSELEKIAKETERELKMQLESLTDWPELDRLSAVWRNTVAALTPMSAMGFFELRCSYSDFGVSNLLLQVLVQRPWEKPDMLWNRQHCLCLFEHMGLCLRKHGCAH